MSELEYLEAKARLANILTHYIGVNYMTTRQQAIRNVQRNSDAQWAYDVDDEGNVYVAGNDWRQAEVQARKDGHNGPVIRVYPTSR